MRVADYIIQRLEAAGIDHVFTVCGGGSIFLNDALGKAAKMQYVACHHEQAAAMAAEAYARARTAVGCAMVTSGPGGTNAITGVAGAWLDHVPTITISGQCFSTQLISSRVIPGLRTLGVQEINIIDLVTPVTKYAVMVMDPTSIRYHLEAALYFAQEGRPGPVWIDIPADIQNAQVDPAELIGFVPPQGRGARGEGRGEMRIDEVVDLLRNAKRPLLHIGQGIRLAGALDELNKFLDATGIPVVTARNGNDLIASDHPQYVGRPGTFAQRGANFAVQTCDLYIAIGTRLSLAQTGYNAKDYARNAKVVMVDIDRSELEKNTVHVDLKIQADAGDFLRALNVGLRTQDSGLSGGLGAFTQSSVLSPQSSYWAAWLHRCKAWQSKYPAVTEQQKNQTQYANSYHLIDELSDQCTEDDIIVTDMGFAFQNTHQAWKVKLGQRLFTNCGLAAMGWGLPAAIGAAKATGRRVILIVGDGGLMMNLQELATLKHHNLNVKVFLLNNGGYLTMRQSQAHAFDGYMGSDARSGLSFPSFGRLAQSFGLYSFMIWRSDHVKAIVSATMTQQGPAMCEISMDPNQPCEPKSINRREEDGTIRQTAIEDAWPYLDRDELAKEMAL